MSDDAELIAKMKDASFTLDRELRHRAAILRSDFHHLIKCLDEAATRFSDCADLIEKGSDVTGFLRASAERYRSEAKLAVSP